MLKVFRRGILDVEVQPQDTVDLAPRHQFKSSHSEKLNLLRLRLAYFPSFEPEGCSRSQQMDSMAVW